MGNRINLAFMLGLPPEIECPQHKGMIKSGFDAVDIECGKPIVGWGIFHLHCYCGKCDHEFYYDFSVEIKLPRLE